MPDDIGELINLRKLLLSFAPISSLPDSICKLQNLQVLDLGFCESLTHLPEHIGYIRSIEKLNLDYTNILSVPNSVTNVTGLQTLGYSPCRFDNYGMQGRMPSNIGKLVKLEDLGEYVVGRNEGHGIGERKDMNNLRGDLDISSLENIDTVEESLMANLKSKRHLRGDNVDTKEEEMILEALKPHPSALKCLTAGASHPGFVYKGFPPSSNYYCNSCTA